MGLLRGRQKPLGLPQETERLDYFDRSGGMAWSPASLATLGNLASRASDQIQAGALNYRAALRDARAGVGQALGLTEPGSSDAASLADLSRARELTGEDLDVSKVESLSDLARMGTKSTLQSAPELGFTLGAAGAGFMAGGPPGALLAATAVNVPAFFGRNIREQREQGIPSADVGLGRAAAMAVPQAAADSLISLLLPGVGKSLGGGALSRAGIGMLEGALIEAPTEVLQEAGQILQANPALLAEFGPEVKNRLGSAGVLGGYGGATVGGASGLARGDGSAGAPVNLDAGEALDAARARVRVPTDAQKASGRYRKGYAVLHDMDVAIETPKGAMRSGVDPDGKPWSVQMPVDYGYIRRTKGADGDAVDVFIGPSPKEQRVYVIDQRDAGSGVFDEHKAMVGFPSVVEAVEAYKGSFSDGRGADRIASIRAMPVDQFKTWAKTGDTKKPLGNVPLAITPDDVHRAADAAGIPWDDDAAFMAATRRLTGKARLDELSDNQLGRVFGALRNGSFIQPPASGDVDAMARALMADDKAPKPGRPVKLTRWLSRMGAPVDEGFVQAVDARRMELAEAYSGAAPQIAPTFYSALQRGVDGVKQPKADAAQWKGIVSNLPGVKAEEVEWTGVNEWLDGQTGPVTKDALNDYIKSNGVKVEEVVRGSPVVNKASKYYGPQVQRALDEASGEVRDNIHLQLSNDGQAYAELTKKFPELSEDDNWADVVLDDVLGGVRNTDVKFGTYVLPGGNSYRELLLTMPTPAKNLSERMTKIEGYLRNAGDFDDHEIAAYRKEYKTLAEKIRAANVFQSTHFSEPNILAHVRFNERTDGDGRKVLFIEEIQSDWHQKGRDKGYKGALVYDTINTVSGHLGQSWSTQKQAEDYIASLPVNVRSNVIVRPNQLNGYVPDAPFKKTWHELAFKRALRWAAENGFDSVAWTRGEQQVDRYKESLREAVDRIEWNKTKDGIQIVGYKKGNRVVDTVEKESAISDAIGKSMGDKIIASPDQSGSFEGDDITVSDTGMAGFYDKILPAYANKLGKKYGAKVKDSKIGADPTDGDNPVEVRVFEYEDGSASVEHGGYTKEFDTVEEAEAYRAQVRGGKTVHSLVITPEMRASIMGGLPLFSAPRAPSPRDLQTEYRTNAAALMNADDARSVPMKRQTDGGISLIGDQEMNTAGLPVVLGYFRGAVVPYGTKPDVLERLRRNGVNTVRFYKDGDEDARARAVERFKTFNPVTGKTMSARFMEQQSRLREEGEAIIAQVTGGKGRVSWEPHIYGGGEALKRSTGQSSARREIAGKFDPLTSLMTVSMSPYFDSNKTAAHESWHWLRQNGVFTKGNETALRSNWETLKDVVRKDGLDPSGMSDEEIEATAFSVWHRAQKAGAPLKIREKVAVVFQKIARFFERFTEAAMGRGFQTLDDVFEAAAKGSIAERGRAAPNELAFLGRGPAGLRGEQSPRSALQ